jgi:hypothetical protein
MMKYLNRLLIIGLVLFSIVGFAAARAASGSITVVNNSSRAISHVYLSHTNSDDWSDDQLNDSAIAAGQSRTIGNINWDQSQVKVVAENADGCFLSTVVDSGGSVTWTITDSTAANCGGN